MTIAVALVLFAEAGCTAADTHAQTADTSAVSTAPTPVPANPACFADGTPLGPDSPASALSLVANRTRGVAPLAVFLEAQGPVAKDAGNPFHDVAYCWNFGDPSSGAFAPTGKSRDTARGPVASHVFEKPGSYRVTITARTPKGETTSRAVTVVVEDPEVVFKGSATHCYSSSGNFAGCPQGAEQVVTDGLSQLASDVEPGARLLLRRGDRFNATPVPIAVAGPGLVGAFGDGPAPKITTRGDTFTVADRSAKASDWRIMDLDIDGSGDAKSSVVNFPGTASNILLLRLGADHIGGGFAAPLTLIDFWNNHGFPGNDVTDGLTIADCQLRGLTGGSGHNYAKLAGHRLSLLGNSFRNSTGGEHIVRGFWIDRGVLSDNDLGVADRPRQVLKIHAPSFRNANSIAHGRRTERVVISDNRIDCSGGLDWCVGLGPENETSDERVADILFERNLLRYAPSRAKASVGVSIWGQHITARDNIIDMGSATPCFVIKARGVEPPPEDVALVNNTCYTRRQVRAVLALVPDSRVKNVTIYNNLVAAPDAAMLVPPTNEANVSGKGGNVTTSRATFASPSPVKWEDYAPASSGPTPLTGDSKHASVWDFSGHQRSAHSTPSAGAIEPH
jgi:hypothetical protein